MNKAELIKVLAEMLADKMEIEEEPTNGEVIMALYPNDKVYEMKDCFMVIGSEFQYQHHYPKEFWNSPYQRGGE